MPAELRGHDPTAAIAVLLAENGDGMLPIRCDFHGHAIACPMLTVSGLV